MAKPSVPNPKRADRFFGFPRETVNRIRNARSRAEFYPLITDALAAYFNATACALFIQLDEGRIDEAVFRRKDGRFRHITFPVRGENVLAKAFQNKRVINLPAALASDLADVPYLDKYAGDALLAVPLACDGDLYGLIVVLGDASKGGFSPEAEAACRAAGEEIEIALSAIRDREAAANELDRLRWENQQLSLVVSTPQALMTGDPELTLTRVLEELRKGLAFDRGAVFAYDAEYDVVRQVATVGFSAEEAGLAAETFRGGTAYRAMVEGRTVLAADPWETLEGPTRPSAERGSYIIVPVKRGDESIGVVTVASDTREAYGAADVKYVQALAEITGAAVEYAYQLGAESKRAAQLSFINELGKKALVTKASREIYENIVTGLRDKFNYYNVAVYSLEAGGDELVLEAIAGGFAKIIPVGYRQKLDAGLIGAAGRENKTVLANDVAREPRFLNIDPRAMPTRSELCVPIAARGDVLGVIDIQSLRPGAFEDSDVLLLETLADQITAILENAALYREEQARASELALLNQVGKKVLGAGDVPALLSAVSDALRKHFKYFNVAILLTDPNRPGYLKAVVVAGAYEREVKLPFYIPLGRGMVGWAAEKGELAFSNDAANDPRYAPDPLPARSRSEIAVPVKIGDKVLGVLDVQEDRAGAFRPSDVDVLQAAADQIAIALSNLTLLTRERQATNDAQTLLHISHIISQTVDLEKSLEFLVEETAVAIDADGAVLVTLDAEGAPTVIKNTTGFAIDPDEAASFDLGASGVFQEAVASGKPVLIADAAADTRASSDLIPGFAAGAVALTTIRKKNRVLGVLAALWEKPSPPLTENAVNLLEAIAFQAAIGIENLLFFQSLTRQTKYLSILSSVASEASRLPPLKELLSAALQNILPFAEADGGIIHLYDDKHDAFVAVAECRRDRAKAEVVPALASSGGEYAAAFASPETRVAAPIPPGDPFGFVPTAEGGPASYVSLPLISQQRVRGRVTLWFYGARPLSPEEIALVQTICDELSIFVENAQLFAQTSGQMKELLTLLDTTKAITSSLDKEDVVYNIAQKVKDLIGADECTVFLLDKAGGMLEPIVSLTAYPEEVMKVRLKVGEGLTGHVAQTGVGEYVNDARTDDRSVTVPGTPTGEVESLLSVPLIAREEVIGVMTLGRLRGDVFTDRDLQLLTLFGGQVAGTIENAGLFDRLLSSIATAEEHRRKLDAVFTSISDAIIVTDPGLRIMEVNPAAEKMLGRNAQDLVNRHVRSVIETPALHEIFESSQKRLTTETAAEFEFATATADGVGTNYYRVVVDAVTGAQGEKVGLVATFRDITESRELALLKENFIANVSHELRTPLTSIIGSAELILDDRQAADLPYYQFVNIIDKEARRLRELVESILDFSLLESGRLELNIEPIDLSDIVEETIRRYKSLADDAGVTVACSGGGDIPTTYADPRLIETVIGNLVKNAVRFNLPGGAVDIKLRVQDSEAVVEVSDNGPGIPADELQNIFSKFYQVDGSTTRAVGGTGLGLAIAKRAIEAHGGRITVATAVGKGSTFVIYLPLRDSPPLGAGK